FFALVVLALIDWDHQILPDVITLPGILAGLAGTFLPGALVDWKEAGLAAGLGYVAFLLVAQSYARLRGIEGLGEGDWKLAAMMGSFLGVERLMLTVFLASLSGMIYGLGQALRLRREAAQLPVAPPVAEFSPAARPIGVSPGPSEEAEAPPVSIGKYKLPFGTFLAASAIFVLFCGDPILEWYASLFRF
ncbi:MAG: A24 family peptidase, partial [Vicinamibacteria bacterium]